MLITFTQHYMDPVFTYIPLICISGSHRGMLFIIYMFIIDALWHKWNRLIVVVVAFLSHEGPKYNSQFPGNT